MKKTVLIVDDFENTRWVIQFTLRKLECEILQAKDGAEALRFFDGKAIDLLITDLNMPVMNGIELVQKVRSDRRYEFMPIIMLTTETNPEKIKKANEVRITTWIKKPFEQEAFLKIVLKCLNQSIR
jgi:two-component system, chemotaxis family, chemotaxis protein CheY